MCLTALVRPSLLLPNSITPVLTPLTSPRSILNELRRVDVDVGKQASEEILEKTWGCARRLSSHLRCAGLEGGGQANTTGLGELVVPQIVHQTWKTEVIPEKWLAARQSCMDMHPGYEFRLWTDDSARELIATELPQLLPTYDSYVYGIERADAIRCATFQIDLVSSAS